MLVIYKTYYYYVQVQEYIIIRITIRITLECHVYINFFIKFREHFIYLKQSTSLLFYHRLPVEWVSWDFSINGDCLAHRRSNKKREERATKRKIRHELRSFINQMAWRDSMKAETVCLTSHVTLRDYGYSMFGEKFSTTFIPDVDMGYILTDSYGRGAFQQWN